MFTFEEYFSKKLENTNLLYGEYKGISKRAFPKWPGWKIIASYKADGIDIKQIQDERLDVLVENFYFLQYLKESS